MRNNTRAGKHLVQSSIAQLREKLRGLSCNPASRHLEREKKSLVLCIVYGIPYCGIPFYGITSLQQLDQDEPRLVA
jgi:hypothetical protein